MSEMLTLEIPDDLVQRARALAAATHRRLEDLLVESLRRAVDEPPVESMADEELLALCDAALGPAEQEVLSDLLQGQRERTLTESEQAQLDELMATYRRGLVLKARAIREAVARGLRPSLNDDAA